MDIDTTPLSPPLVEIFWENHRQKIIAATVLTAVLIILLGSFLFWKRSKRLAADGLLSSATGVGGWQLVVNHYPHSGAAANALLLIGGAQAQNHQIEASNKTYTQFLKYFPHYPLAISARLGIAMNEDSMGHPEQAVQELQQAVAVYPKSYGAPQALLLQARILSRLGKKEEAKRVLQMIENQYPDSLVSTIVLKQEMMRLK